MQIQQTHPLFREATLSHQAREALKRNSIRFRILPAWQWVADTGRTWSLAIFAIDWPNNLPFEERPQQILTLSLADSTTLFLSYGDQEAPVYIDVFKEGA